MKKSIPKLIEEFLYLSPEGDLLENFDAFREWSLNKYKKNTLEEKVKLFIDFFIETYGEEGKGEFIEVPKKIKETYKDGAFLDELFFIDYYSIKGVDLTRLSVLLKQAKVHSNLDAIKRIIAESIDQMYKFVEEKNIDAICFVSPSVKREHQFMNILKKQFIHPVPKIEISKIKYTNPVAQKELNTLQERIKNARSTFIVEKISSRKVQKSFVSRRHGWFRSHFK